ncbi:hypothetical protein MSG28_010780 [Choristoneura fumiferana]|uniref:Uncharacterized protein n=1 Tax=Choristoneura fumiferana TaxID=7141 RepID=A0ACC0KPS2_CHOFU|nr:hypothetical protein MSG28_010780 [Choristoneura fumiferana]
MFEQLRVRRRERGAGDGAAAAAGAGAREEELFRAVAALARLAHHSQEVAQLVALVGPPPAAFRGTSPRCDEKIDLIMQKVKGCPVSGECAFGLRQAGGMKEQLISFDPAWDRAPTLARRGSSSRRTHVDAQ